MNENNTSNADQQEVSVMPTDDFSPAEIRLMQNEREDNLLSMTSGIVSAYVGNNPASMADVPGFIGNVHAALSALGARPEPEAPAAQQEPAVPVRQSVKPDYIVCLEDGKKLKMLKRHLQTVYGMTPAQYREKWNLPADYPMTAPNYAEQRRALAVKSGLGKRPGADAAPAEENNQAAPVSQQAPQQAAPLPEAAPANQPVDEAELDQTTEQLASQQG